MTTSLTPSQQAILAYALEHTDGCIQWVPTNLRGGARKKVLDSLFHRALITPSGEDWHIATEGYDALGHPRLGAELLSASGLQHVESVNAENASIEYTETMNAQTGNTESGNNRESTSKAVTCAEKPAAIQSNTRQNSKQAQVMAMLRMPEGVTIPQICASTGWQQHTVRGMFSGVFKKKLGLTIISDKTDAGDRAYRIA